jgi:SAM-dependent methyltransferase
LTARCGLADRIDHVCGDVLEADLAPGGHDAVVSWLALYHIADPARLFSRLAHALAPGGGLYVEDFYRLGAFADHERAILDQVIYAQSLPPRDDYIAAVEAAGFTDVRFTDMTAPWAAFVAARAAAYREGLDDHAALHGADVAGGLDMFYDTVVKLFGGGAFAGVRLTATKA